MEQDEESEYIQMGARTYNPALGRFMSVDPLFEAFPGQSAYSYAFNSPLSWSDPTGLAPEKEKKRDRVLYNLLWQQVQESIEWSNSIDNEFNYFRSLSSTLFMSEEYNGIGEVYKGGGGNRTGEGGGGGNTVFNGATKDPKSDNDSENDTDCIAGGFFSNIFESVSSAFTSVVDQLAIWAGLKEDAPASDYNSLCFILALMDRDPTEPIEPPLPPVASQTTEISSTVIDILSPDYIGFSIGMSAVGGVGGSTSLDFNWIIQGENSGWSPIITVSQSVEVGMNVSPLFFSLNTFEFWGNELPRAGFLETSLENNNVGLTYSSGLRNWGGSASISPAKDSYITGMKAIYSPGSYGPWSAGLFNTYIIKR